MPEDRMPLAVHTGPGRSASNAMESVLRRSAELLRQVATIVWSANFFLPLQFVISRLVVPRVEIAIHASPGFLKIDLKIVPAMMARAQNSDLGVILQVRPADITPPTAPTREDGIPSVSSRPAISNEALFDTVSIKIDAAFEFTEEILRLLPGAEGGIVADRPGKRVLFRL